MLELPSMCGELVQYLSITNIYLVIIAFCWRTFPFLQTSWQIMWVKLVHSEKTIPTMQYNLKVHTANGRLQPWRGVLTISSYSAASNSWRWCGWKNLGRTCCLMVMRRKNGNGNSIPAIGIHVTPKHTSRYTIWKMVNAAICLKGTDSTKEAWVPSRTLSCCFLKTKI